jgi:hypothetical protein
MTFDRLLRCRTRENDLRSYAAGPPGLMCETPTKTGRSRRLGGGQCGHGGPNGVRSAPMRTGLNQCFDLSARISQNSLTRSSTRM